MTQGHESGEPGVAPPPPPRHQQDTMRNWLLGGLLLAIVLTLITIAAPVIIPIFMAGFIATVLRSPVRALGRWRVPRPLAAGLVFIGAALITTLLINALYEPAADWVRQAPQVAEKVERKLSPLKQTIEEASQTAEKIEKATDLSVEKTQPVAMQQPSLVERLFATSRTLLAQVAVTLMLAFFMLAIPQPLLPPSLTDRFGERGRRFRQSMEEIERQMSRYMGALIAVNLGVGVLTTGAMYLLGMPTPILWGALAALLGLVPYIGPLVTMGLIGSAAFITFDAWPAMLAPVAAYVIINLTESEVVTPMIMGKVMLLHPVAIFIFVLIWSWMLGLAGAFLAVPILVACVVAARNLLWMDDESPMHGILLRSSSAPPEGMHQEPVASAGVPNANLRNRSRPNGV